jgi:NodT family efflux transporter outer membrane factor (OMF) lipoprotein
MTPISPSPARAAALLAALAPCGCGVGPSYHRPALDVPVAYSSVAVVPAMARTTPPALPTADWWRGFGVAELDRLMDLAAADSPDVAAAAARIVQADQAARVAGSPLLPAITGTLGQNYQRTGASGSGFSSFSSLVPTTGTGTTTTAGGTTTGTTTGGTTSTTSLLGSTAGQSHYLDVRTYSAELSASYEVDFWGKNLDALRAARATALASRFDAQTVWLTTASSIATTYFQAAGYRDRLAIARSNLKTASDVLDAFRGRLTVGTASLLDVSQQEALVAGYRAQIPALQSEYRQEVLALGILVGLPPERIALDPAPLVSLTLPEVDPGLPADLLRRRPDVANAEEQLVSQNQTVRQDFANFFPSLQLTAGGGVSSAALSMITGPGTVVANLASQLVQTVFDNGLKSGTLGEAKGRYRELAADYAKSVLQALTDAETALTQAGYAAEQERLEAEAVRTAQRSADIARAQLQAGTVDIVTVLNTQTTLFGDQDTLAQVRISRFTALVSLYKALGGGWSREMTEHKPT